MEVSFTQRFKYKCCCQSMLWLCPLKERCPLQGVSIKRGSTVHVFSCLLLLRLRVVAGNKCTNTTETAKLLAYERRKCSSHEDTSGIDLADEVQWGGCGLVIIPFLCSVIASYWFWSYSCSSHWFYYALLAAAGLAVYCVIKFRQPREL